MIDRCKQRDAKGVTEHSPGQRPGIAESNLPTPEAMDTINVSGIIEGVVVITLFGEKRRYLGSENYHRILICAVDACKPDGVWVMTVYFDITGFQPFLVNRAQITSTRAWFYRFTL